MPNVSPNTYRLGELARRVGVSARTVRTWARRYGFLAPDRTPGGHRVFDKDDLTVLESVLTLRDEGLAMREIAELGRELLLDRRALREVAAPESGLIETLVRAASRLDQSALTQALDRASQSRPLEEVVRGVVLPALNRIRARWLATARQPVEERLLHQAVRARLQLELERASATSETSRGTVLSACPVGTDDDLLLLLLLLTPARAGHSVLHLGPSVDWDTIEWHLQLVAPRATVLWSRQSVPRLAQIADRWGRESRLILCGPAAAIESAPREDGEGRGGPGGRETHAAGWELWPPGREGDPAAL